MAKPETRPPLFRKINTPEANNSDIKMEIEINKTYNMDCLKGLRNVADNSVDCCITSPHYFGLRDYGVDGQIGLEKSPNEYVSKLVKVFREVHRVIRPCVLAGCPNGGIILDPFMGTGTTW